MEFSVNHPVLYLLAGILIAVVLAQSVFFLIRAYLKTQTSYINCTKSKNAVE